MNGPNDAHAVLDLVARRLENLSKSWEVTASNLNYKKRERDRASGYMLGYREAVRILRSTMGEPPKVKQMTEAEEGTKKKFNVLVQLHWTATPAEQNAIWTLIGPIVENKFPKLPPGSIKVIDMKDGTTVIGVFTDDGVVPV